MIIESSFLLLFLRRHGFGDVDAATVEHVEQHAGFGAFGKGEGCGSLILCRQQFNHRVIRRDFAFKEALLLLFTTCHLSAHDLDSLDCVVKGLVGLGKLIEGTMRPARTELSLPERFELVDLFSKSGGTTSEI